ncbi:broad specificity phosphatase PhoE [Pseudomonas nitritireducens]|uniref:Broad specificity phosphatase PhoE n=1 Tax=Pseudomonas nitroreducens TaxID=46680 RepID=A0A7W7KR43_PSENT|nr:histidine phosphatase family protein [Pseudomonas nitritireducens]MBB4867166.1 broad specificity phosphatase PhoE [Pseudomonas nitritireducens]
MVNLPLIVRLHRHGESASNAGQATSDPATIELTQLGHAQAAKLAEGFEQAPSTLIVSPFSRARATAAPLIGRFPDLEPQEWPIYEFTYLAPARCEGMNAAQRRPLVDEYWSRADVDWVDGHEAESFSSMVGRARQCLERLQELQGEVVVVGHGQVMQMIRMLVSDQPVAIDAAFMRHFRSYDMANMIKNCEGFTLEWDGHRWSIV